MIVIFKFPAAPSVGPSSRWGQTLCPIDAQTAILIGGQGARMQICKDPLWKLCTGQSLEDTSPCTRLFSAHLRASALVSVRQRTCPGWQQRLWRRGRRPRPGLATPLCTTRTLGRSLCLEALKRRSGSMMFTSWTLRAGGGPW